MRTSEQTLAILSGLSFMGNLARIEATLDRTAYVQVNKALEALGGKWDRKQKGHVFPSDAEALVLGLIDAGGEYTDSKKELGFFPTPLSVAQRVLEAAELEEGQTILEPSFGTGDLLAPLQLKEVVVVALDIEDRVGRKNPEVTSFEFVQADFLSLSPMALSKAIPGAMPFDRVIMNPPFAKGQDLAHILHAHTFLKPGSGKLVAVAAAGVSFRQDKKALAFRQFVFDRGGTITPLPVGSFKASGTMVNTVLVEIPVS